MLDRDEKEKYSKAWITGAEGQSRTAWYMFNFLKLKLTKDMKILDIGCGNGMIVELLRQEGFVNVFGIDITLEGLKGYKAMISPERFHQPVPTFTPQIENYIECPIWQTPFKDNEFDFTFSTDVMEHIPPELVIQTIKEIYRITYKETSHCIALFKDRRAGIDFHLSVHDLDWWKNEFLSLNTKNLNCEIISRANMLTNSIPNFRGK